MHTWRVGISLSNTIQYIDVLTDTVQNAALYAPMNMYLKRQDEGLPDVSIENMSVVYVARRDLFG